MYMIDGTRMLNRRGVDSDENKICCIVEKIMKGMIIMFNNLYMVLII